MFISRLVAVAALVVPCGAFATNAFNVTTSSCSGSLVASFTDGVSLACIGDYSLSGGLIESSQSIFLSATGSLSLLDVTLKAPTVILNSGNVLTLGEDTKVDVSGVAVLSSTTIGASSAIFNEGAIDLRQPQHNIRIVNLSTLDIGAAGTVHFQQPGTSRGEQLLAHGVAGTVHFQPGTVHLSTVPEPHSIALLLGGLLSAGLVMARKRSKSQESTAD